jgi:type II secretory pathway pseudopilin PulG
MKNMRWHRQAGQSIVEAIVVVVIVVLLVTGLVSGTTASLRTSRAGRTKSQAIHYSQEGVELTRAFRDQGWIEFRARSGLWCLDKTGVWSLGDTGCLPNIDNTYTRSVLFDWADPIMTITIRVTWKDETGDREVSVVTYLTQWK